MDLWDDRPPKPKRPPNVCEPGQLIVPRWYGDDIPVLVLDVQCFWGNPNGDNTADHWYWRYYINPLDEYMWCSAKDWRLFQAR